MDHNGTDHSGPAGITRAAASVVVALAFAALLVGFAPSPPRPPGSQGVGPHDGATVPYFPPAPIAQVPTMAFGTDASSAANLATLGIPADYGTLWVGAWTLKWGWSEPDRQLASLRAMNVTPAVHFYYWGDDLSRRCLELGCAGKSQAGWDLLAQQLAAHLNATMQGSPALVFLETEFNKADVARYKPLDAQLAQKATLLAQVAGVHVVLALGNWNPDAWPTWSAAAAASDFTGLQAMFGTTRDPPDAQATLVNRTVAGARALKADFGKPVILHDLAFSSFPEPAAVEPQAATVRMFFDCLAPLKAAGVQAMLYRGLHDDPTMALGNHYGLAERHFGLAWPDGLKPAGAAWRDGVQRERASAVEPGDAPGCGLPGKA